MDSVTTTPIEVPKLDEVPIKVTDDALVKVLEVRAEEDDPEELALRIEVVGVSGVDYTYDLAFVPVDEASQDELSYQNGDLSILIPAESYSMLAGATLDLPSDTEQGGLVIRNPNRPNPLGDLGDLELTGEVAERVTQLLEHRINPSLASHGGFATLVGIEDDKVYITMGGGCQGCSMSQATLTEGIRAAILELIPEVSDVIDATDHSAGDNPFYS